MADPVRNLAEELEFPSQGIIFDRAGLKVDATGWVWALNHAVMRSKLDFKGLNIRSPAILRAVVMFIADKVKTSSVDDVRNSFQALKYLRKSEHFREIELSGGILEAHLISDLKQVPTFAHDRLHYIRAWYSWCAKWGFYHFSENVAERLREMKIGGNETGHAVRTQDPIKGAFDELEYIALITKLRALGPVRLTTQENTLAWLALAAGANPLAYALTREDDFETLKEHGTERVYARVNLPRIKKGDPHYRAQSHPKDLNDEGAAWVTKLIVENQGYRDQNGWPEGCELPLFRRLHGPDEEKLTGPLRAFAMHMSPEDITLLLKTAIDKLEIISHRTGEPLVVNMRRFRRTYGTRAVEEGASPSDLAVMLDHSDLTSIWAYFESRASQVRRLDAATALRLGPIADAFMGRIVRSERDAVNGDNPAKRIPWFRRFPDRMPEKNGELGTCGSGPCGLLAPVSCYTCIRFQPWKDGAHREVLDWLCDEREQKRMAGYDAQIVGLHDATILAVAEVVKACEEAPS